MLSLHIIPGGALLSSQLTEGQQLNTSLAGEAPLTVDLSNGTVQFHAFNNSARVIVPNIKAGNSVIHVVNDVLLPRALWELATGAAPASEAVISGSADFTAAAPAHEPTVTLGEMQFATFADPP